MAERVTMRRGAQRAGYGDDGRRRRGAAGWLIALLLILGIGLLLWYVLSRGDDADTGSTSSTTEDVGTGGATDDGGTIGGGGTDLAAGSIVVDGGTDLLASAQDAAALSSFEGQTVSGSDVEVLAVVADEGFWSGTDEANRVFVRIDTTGESPVDVDAGDTVSFDGTLQVVPDGAEAQFGISTEEGLDQLEQQGYYVSATNLNEQPAS